MTGIGTEGLQALTRGANTYTSTQYPARRISVQRGGRAGGRAGHVCGSSCGSCRALQVGEGPNHTDWLGPLAFLPPLRLRPGRLNPDPGMLSSGLPKGSRKPQMGISGGWWQAGKSPPHSPAHATFLSAPVSRPAPPPQGCVARHLAWYPKPPPPYP